MRWGRAFFALVRTNGRCCPFRHLPTGRSDSTDEAVPTTLETNTSICLNGAEGYADMTSVNCLESDELGAVSAIGAGLFCEKHCQTRG